MTKDELIELAQVGMGINLPNSPEYIVCEALIKALAQPEQEPERYTGGNGTAGREADVRPTGFFFQMPKQRTWVGLTDEEIMGMLDYGQYGRVPQYARNFVDAIEAKLREKNTCT